MPLWRRASRQRREFDLVPDDNRGVFQRDRDRILYSSAFRRLAGITQVVRAGEAEVFHTRQQHTLKVAQIGRRLAERCLRQQPRESKHHGIDPDVVEAACLAHDLGHPPFGHIAEYLLHDLVSKSGDEGGFEGNAQTFRIITRLSLRFDGTPGLDLTRASLSACLKYPWLRDGSILSRSKKWGAFITEAPAFDFARNGFKHDTKTAEAEIMDWSDDVAYSVHDLEDLHRCGLIPWAAIRNDTDIQTRIVRQAARTWFDAPVDGEILLRDALNRLLKYLVVTYSLTEQYDGSRRHRIALRTLTSDLIRRYGASLKLRIEDDIRLSEPLVIINESEEHEVRILKQITRDYLIDHPSLIAQQKGQKTIITSLFEMICGDGEKSPPPYLPRRLHHLWDEDIFGSPARASADCIASLTEMEVIGLHNRLHGTFSGSVLDPIVR